MVSLITCQGFWSFFIFFQVKRVLYIFAGQRSKEYLNDFLGYHVDTGTIEVVSDGTNKESCQAGIALMHLLCNPFFVVFVC